MTHISPTFSEPPKLLFAVASLKKGSGGIAELSRQVLRALIELQAEGQISLQVQVLEESAPDQEDDLLQAGQPPPFHWFNGHRLRFAFGLLAARADLIVMDHVGLARLPGCLPARVRPRYVVLIHGVEIWKQDRPDYHRSARNACLLIANSDYTARKSLSRYPDLPPLQVCLPGKDLSSQSNGLGNAVTDRIGPGAMLIVGRLDALQRHKGHDHLLKAMPLILQQVPDAQLIIAGTGDDRNRLEQLARTQKLEQNVIFTGWCDESQLQALYSRCAVFVMPSDGDGFGLVFLEAMQFGLPCVGLVNSAAAEILEHGVSGILVDREDTEAMANELAKLLLDPEYQRKLGNEAAKRYQSQFRSAHYSARLKSVLIPVLRTVHAT